jgi:peptidyl-prolyl cis-trans isomerase SurA
MRKHLFFAQCLAAVVLAGAPLAIRAQQTGNGMLLDGVAAYVNERMITIADVMTEVRNSVWVELPKAEREAKLRELYTATLDAMIDRRLILDAAKASKAQVAAWAVENRVQEIIDQRFGGDRAKLVAALTERRMTYEEWHTSIEEDLMIQLMRYGQVERNVSIPPKDVRDYYTAHTGAFVSQGGVHVAMIVFAAAKDGSATLDEQGAKILKDLAGGMAFAAAAKMYSQDGKAAKGGDWGIVDPAEVFRPEIAEALGKLKVGENSAAILLEDFGYVVRKIDEKKPRPLTLEEAWPLVESRLRLQQSEQRYKDWVGRLRSKAYIKVYELPQPKQP